MSQQTEGEHFFGTLFGVCFFNLGVFIMGYYFKPYERAFDDFIEWLFADKQQRKILKYVPRYCQHCEVLAMCRDNGIC